MRVEGVAGILPIQASLLESGPERRRFTLGDPSDLVVSQALAWPKKTQLPWKEGGHVESLKLSWE